MLVKSLIVVLLDFLPSTVNVITPLEVFVSLTLSVGYALILGVTLRSPATALSELKGELPFVKVQCVTPLSVLYLLIEKPPYGDVFLVHSIKVA